MSKTKVLPIRNFIVFYDEITNGNHRRTSTLLLAQSQKQAIQFVEREHAARKVHAANYKCSKAGKVKEV